LGFSKANNLAIKQASGRDVLLLNTDTEVKADALQLSLDYLDSNSDIGVLGCKVLLPDGSLDPACRRNFPNPVNSFLRLFGLKKFSNYNIAGPLDETRQVDAVMGAFMMVKKIVIDKAGLLDEDFFMYGEDLDWCWRIKEAGYKIVYYPKATIVHYKYGSSQSKPFATIRMSHEAMKIFYHKHYAASHGAIFNWVVGLGISARMYLVVLKIFFSSKKTVH
jgi:hypothetical protein